MSNIPEWLAWAQIGASIALGLAAVVVAGLSAIWSYRSNFGWSPSIVVTHIAVDDDGHSFMARPHFEFWNRHRYPVVIRAVNLTFSDAQMDTGLVAEMFKTGWLAQPGGKSALLYRDIKVEGNASQSFDPEFPLKRRAAEQGAVEHGRVSISISYYDPRAHKVFAVQETHTLDMHSFEMTVRQLSTPMTKHP